MNEDNKLFLIDTSAWILGLKRNSSNHIKNILTESLQSDLELYQPEFQEKLDNISINAVINDNIFNLKKCKMRLGEGYLYIKNEIDNSNKSLKLGKLNLGIFKLWTNAKGLTCHIPQYMPQKEVVKIYFYLHYQRKCLPHRLLLLLYGRMHFYIQFLFYSFAP